MSDIIGQAVAGYPIEKLLGKGAYSSAWQAATSAAPLAIKLLNDELRSNAALNGAVAEGWEAARAVNHPNMVTVYSTGVDPAHGAFCLEEVVKGKSLRQIVLEGSKIALRDCLIMAEQLFSALQALHAAKCCHGDLWPSNVLITQDQDLKIEGSGGLSKIAATHLDVVKGPSMGYLAPEIIAGSPAHPGADLYSAGACLYFTLAAQDPFPGEKAEAVAAAVMQRKAPPLSVLCDDLAPEAEEFIGRLMAKDPTQRYASAADVLADVGRLKNGKPLAPLKGGTPAPAARQRAQPAPVKQAPATHPVPVPSSGQGPAAPPAGSSGVRRFGGAPAAQGTPAGATRIFGRLETHVKSTIPQSDTEKRGDDQYRQGHLPLALQAWKDAFEEGTPHAGLKVKIELAERELKKEIYASGLQDARDRMNTGDFKGAINRVRESITSAENEQQRAEALKLEQEIIDESHAAEKKDTRKFIIAGAVFVCIAIALLIFFSSGKKEEEEATGTPGPGTTAPGPGPGPTVVTPVVNTQNGERYALPNSTVSFIRPAQWVPGMAHEGMQFTVTAAGKTVATMKIGKFTDKVSLPQQLEALRLKGKAGKKIDDWENFKVIDGKYQCAEMGFSFKAPNGLNDINYFYLVKGPSDTLFVVEFSGTEIEFSGELRGQMRDIMKSWTFQK